MGLYNGKRTAIADVMYATQTRIRLKVHAGNLDKKGEKNKSFKDIYIFGFSRPC